MSRARSAAAANRPAARSAPAGGGGARGVYVQAPKSDIFVVMLAIALGAILLGCLLLGLVMNRYNFQTKPTASLAPATSGVLTASSENLRNPEFSV